MGGSLLPCSLFYCLDDVAKTVPGIDRNMKNYLMPILDKVLLRKCCIIPDGEHDQQLLALCRTRVKKNSLSTKLQSTLNSLHGGVKGKRSPGFSLSLLWADPMESLTFQLSDSPMVWRICPDLGAHLLAFESFSLSPWRNPTPTASTPPPRR